MDILIIKLGAMGDVVRTTSIVSALKSKYPSSRIYWITKKSSSELLLGNPHIFELHLIEDLKKDTLLSKEFDLVLGLDDEEEACALASKARSKKIIGAYLLNGKRAYTPDSNQWFDMGLISRFGKEEADRRKAKNTRTYQDLHFEMIGLTDPKKHPPQIFLSEKEKEFGERFSKNHGLNKGDLIIGLNTGASGRWKDKKLPKEIAIKMIDDLHRKLPHAKLILFGGPEEIERNNSILKESKAPLIDGGCKNSVLEFSALVDLCSILVTSDSLALHIGIALGKKILVFFYPTSASEIELYGRGEKIIAVGDSYCSYEQVCTSPPKWDAEKIAEKVISLV